MESIKKIVPLPVQNEFLSASEEEVLFGGSAGGGKSFAVVVDALGAPQSAYNNPKYRALIIRRTFPELKSLIDTSRDIYSAISPKAVYNESKKEWKFPSGAKVIFGYLARDSDKYQYQGQEFQYIAIDELTAFPSSSTYEYLLSRLRASTEANIKCYIRATCNPGGAGHEWVRDRWQIDDQGNQTRITVRENWVRRFIPARLSDNPYLNETGYREQLEALPEAERRALLEGRWDIYDVEGSVYKNEISDMLNGNRYTSVPHDPSLQVITAWDLGMGDATAIWFAQVVGNDVRLIDYYEDSGLSLANYATALQKRATEKGYNYSQHIAPHDIAVRELGTGKSRLDVAQSLGIRFDVAPMISLDDGIEAVRQMLPKVWIDQTLCAYAFNKIRAYRWDINTATGVYKPRPLHDSASHAADALRSLAVGMRKQTIKPKLVRAGNWKTI